MAEVPTPLTIQRIFGRASRPSPIEQRGESVSMRAMAESVVVRPLAVSLVLGVIFVLGFVSSHGNPKPARAQQASRVAVISGFFDAIFRGDVDGAMAAFADN